MPLPTWDVFIGLFFLVGIAYGFILRREKTITTLCSTYIGLVISTQFAQTVYAFFNGNKVLANQLWIRSSAPLSTITIILFIGSILLVSGAIISSSSKNGDLSPVEVVVYSALNVALILSSILYFFPEASRSHYADISRLAKILIDHHTLFVVSPPISLALLNLRRK